MTAALSVDHARYPSLNFATSFGLWLFVLFLRVRGCLSVGRDGAPWYQAPRPEWSCARGIGQLIGIARE